MIKEVTFEPTNEDINNAIHKVYKKKSSSSSYLSPMISNHAHDVTIKIILK